MLAVAGSASFFLAGVLFLLDGVLAGVFFAGVFLAGVFFAGVFLGFLAGDAEVLSSLEAELRFLEVDALGVLAGDSSLAASFLSSSDDPMTKDAQYLAKLVIVSNIMKSRYRSTM